MVPPLEEALRRVEEGRGLDDGLQLPRVEYARDSAIGLVLPCNYVGPGDAVCAICPVGPGKQGMVVHAAQDHRRDKILGRISQQRRCECEPMPYYSPAKPGNSMTQSRLR
jgi:hypothetical protein